VTVPLLQSLRSPIHIQLSGTPIYHTISDWVAQVQWLFPDTRFTDSNKCAQYREHRAEYEYHEYPALKEHVTKLKKAISTDLTNSCDKIWDDIQQCVSPWFIKRWAKSRYANGDPTVDIPEAKIHHLVLKTTEDKYNVLLDRSIEIHSNLVMATINDVSSYYH
jgi:hypothetical protein